MKRKDVYSWLGEVEFPQNPTSSSSSPREEEEEDEFVPTTKRARMSASGASIPRKRLRPVDDLDASSLSTAFTDGSRLNPSVQSSSGASRQKSPARELLNELPHSTPSIHCNRPKSVPLPDKVLSLRRTLCQNFGSGVIPIELKV